MQEDRRTSQMERLRTEAEQWACKLAFDNISEGVLIANADGRIIHANPSARHLFGGIATVETGISIADMIRCYDVRHLEGRPMQPSETPLGRALAGESVTGVELRLRTRSGDERVLSASGAPIRNDAGQIVLAVSIVHDVTDQKAAEEALRANEQCFRTVFDNAAIGIALVDPQGHPIDSNRALQQILGYSADELRRMVFTEFTHPDDAPIDWQLFQELVAGKRNSYQIEKRYYRKDGRMIVGRLTVSCARSAQGKLLFIIGMVEDVTKGRQAEEERDRLLKREQALARIGRALVHEIEVKRVAEVVIAQCQQILGADAVALWLANLTSRQLTLLAHRNLKLETVEAIRRVPFDARLVTARAALTGQVQIVENLEAIEALPFAREIYLQEKLCSLLAAPLINRQRLIGVVTYGVRTPRHFTSRDLEFQSTVTDLFAVALENARLYDDVRETLHLREEFMAAAAHELKTPVTTIKGWADLLLRNKTISGREQRAIDAIARESDRIGRLVDDLLAVIPVQSGIAAGDTVLKRERFDLTVLVQEKVAHMTRRAEQVHFVVAADGPLVVKAERGRIGEVIVRLLENAVRYSPIGGQIEVSARREDHQAVVSVRDCGVGIALERQSHVFEPFYEPVPAGRPGYVAGAGLGLYLGAQVLEAHGGRIWFESTPGQGSTFSFSLSLA